MTLYDLDPQSNVIIKVIITLPNKTKVEKTFQTNLRNVINTNGKEPGYVIDPILVEGKIIKFEKTRIVAIVKNETDGRLYSCKQVNISIEVINDERCHVMRCQGEVKAIERRSALRLSFIEKAQIKFNDDVVVHDAFTQNISSLGILLKMYNHPNIKKGANIHITVTHKKTIYFFNAQIVRIASKDDIYTIFGCSFDKETPELNKLVFNLMAREKRLYDE